MLPSPYDYDNWQDFAAALMFALSGSAGEAESSVTSYTVSGPVPAEQVEGTLPAETAPPPPTGFDPVFWDGVNSALILGTDAFTIGPSPPIVSIDTINIADASIETGKIASGAVTQGIIADGAVVTAKLADAAIVTAKIGTAAIVTAHIGNAQIVTAHIQDASINNAKIANLAVGTANIQDAAITNAKIANLAVGTANIQNLAVTNALIANLAVGTAQIQDLSVSTAKIANLAVGSAQIADAAILSAKIADAAIISAKIANAAILNAHIADATIASAKIASLIVNKIASGTLGAVIDFSGGYLRMKTGGYTLFIGNAFGTTSQFFLWYGPNVTSDNPANCSESTAELYLKTDGSAYFGGTLLAGVLKNGVQTTLQSVPLTLDCGQFSSNGNAISIVISYSWKRTYRCDASTGSISGSGSATVVAEKSDNGGGSYTSLGGNVAVAETERTVIVDGDPGVKDTVIWAMGGSSTYSWTPGVQDDLIARARLTARSEPTFGGTNITDIVLTQNISITTTEQP